MRTFILNKLGIDLNRLVTILGRQWVEQNSNSKVKPNDFELFAAFLVGSLYTY